jgi:hypothetical protein
LALGIPGLSQVEVRAGKTPSLAEFAAFVLYPSPNKKYRQLLSMSQESQSTHPNREEMGVLAEKKGT